MSLVKYNFLLANIFMNVAFSENTDTLKTENFEKLKLKLGLDRQVNLMKMLLIFWWRN